jgi:hypothetical protein
MYIIASVVGIGVGYEIVRVWIFVSLPRVIKKNWDICRGIVGKRSRMSSTGKTYEETEFDESIPYAHSDMEVEYWVKGERYVTRNVNLWDFISKFNFSADVQKDIDKECRGGNEVTISYNPEHPPIAVLRPEFGQKVWYEVVVVIVSLLAVGLFAMYYSDAEGMPDSLSLGKVFLVGIAIGVGLGAIKIRQVMHAISS